MTSRKIRGFAALSATMLAATALVASSGTAGAVISPGVGRNADGTPGFVRDGQGLALQLCADAVNCEAVDPADPAGIGSYFSAEAALGPMRAIWGVDAAFLEDAAGNITTRPGVTNAALFRAEGLRPNSRYTMRGPWGTHRCTTDADGALDNKNCLFEAGGEAGGALRSGPIKSFLFGRSPQGFVGDLVIPQTVTGSPSGFNRVTLRGPGANFSSNRFALGGQMLDNQPMGLLAKDSLRFGSRNNTRVITRTLRYRSVGTAPVTLRVRRAGANRFAFKVNENCGSLAPRSVCRIRVSYNPGVNNRQARLVINDNTLAPPRRVSLTGIAPR